MYRIEGGDDCWWVVETRVWVPAFAGMTEGVRWLAERWRG